MFFAFQFMEKAKEYGWNRDNLSDIFSNGHIDKILTRYTHHQIDFIVKNLSDQQRRSIKDPEDYWSAAVVYSLPIKIWKWYEENFEIRDPYHYISAQKQWLADRKWYLGQKLGKNPSSEEFAEDIRNMQFGLHNRVLYIIKFMSDHSKVKMKE